MIRRIAAIIGIVTAVPMPAGAADRSFVLAVPPSLEQSGLIDHLRPRFSLKTGVRVTVVAQDPQLAEGAEGADLWLTTAPVGATAFGREEQVWYLGERGDDPDARRFLEWLSSEAGHGAITGFAPAEGAAYRPVTADPRAEAAALPEGDAAAGGELALALCGRCHVVGEVNRMKGIGSTPSFALLRGLADWQDRFDAFYALNPHPSFTQVEDVTPGFDPARPPPIVPLRLKLDELEAIIAYVARLAPADLGAPIVAR